MNLDEDILKIFCSDIKYKSISSTSQEPLVKEFLKYNDLNNVFANSSSSYDLANTLRSFDFWFSKRSEEPKYFPVKEGSIYYLDLGAYNLKYETGFIHSCIILKQWSTMVLVIPGSSKKYKKNNFLIEDVKAGDGFRENTGVLIDQSRFVSITRIRGKVLGEIKPETLKRIKDKYLNITLPDLHKSYAEIQNENNTLKGEIAIKEEEIEALKKQLQEISEKNQNQD